MHTFHPSILKTYDIRGIYKETLHDKDAYYWGYLFTHYLKSGLKTSPKVAVCCDTRRSSPTLKKEMTRGILDAGGHVLDIGMGPTPYLYNMTKTLRTQGGVMITGSHNPSVYNGFKTLTTKGPVSDALIKQIAALTPPTEEITPGTLSKREFYGRYLLEIMVHASLMPFSGIRVVWDCGNGAAGIIIDTFIQMYGGREHIPLFTEPNGDFPYHHPDPSDIKNYDLLLKKMDETSAHVGFMFDGDADRVGVVFGGKILIPDQLIAILAIDYLQHWKDLVSNEIILDVKASSSLVEIIERSGGKVVFSPCGHSLIKERMKKRKIGFAGETSGHIFYKHNHNFDDGLLSAFTFLRILSSTPILIEYVQKTWKKTHLSQEIRIPFDMSSKDDLFKKIDQEITKLNMTTLKIDGIRASNDDGWFLIRASNTEPHLSMRVEGNTEEAYHRLWELVKTVLEKSGNPIKVPPISLN
jgi:phosphomannomutase